MTHLPERGHGDDGVPEGGRDRGEGGAVGGLLAVEHDGGEDDDGHRQREHQEAELRRAGLKGVAKDAKTLNFFNTEFCFTVEFSPMLLNTVTFNSKY